jgi:hypothetical protein
MGPKKQAKKCCAKFKLGTCTATNCPFPHVSEAQDAQKTLVEQRTAALKRAQDLEASKILSIRKGIDYDRKMKKRSIAVKPELYYEAECRTCKNIFAMFEGEINWFRSKNLDLPKRCKCCLKLDPTYLFFFHSYNYRSTAPALRAPLRQRASRRPARK